MKKKCIMIIAAAVAASLSACVGNSSIAVPEATTPVESTVAEAIDEPSTQSGANRPEDETIPEEKIDIDISDCKDFDQVIDKLAADLLMLT